MTTNDIISKLPYSKPFLFVDEIESVSEKEIRGNYTFRKEAEFYKGHFKNNPVTPGVILTECMAQIGLVCFGFYFLETETNVQKDDQPEFAMVSHKMDFYLPVFPNEKVTVVSKKKYFRFNKLKCVVKMYNEQKKLVCKGEIAGMINIRFR